MVLLPGAACFKLLQQNPEALLVQVHPVEVVVFPEAPDLDDVAAPALVPHVVGDVAVRLVHQAREVLEVVRPSACPESDLTPLSIAFYRTKIGQLLPKLQLLKHPAYCHFFTAGRNAKSPSSMQYFNMIEHFHCSTLFCTQSHSYLVHIAFYRTQIGRLLRKLQLLKVDSDSTSDIFAD